MASTKEADVSSAADGESYRERLIVTATTKTTIGSAECVTVSSTTTTTTTTSEVLAVSYSPKDQQERQQTSPSSPLSASVQRPSGNNSVVVVVVGGGGDTIGGQKLTSKSTVNPHDLPPFCAAPSSPKVINELSPKLGGTNQNSSKGMTRNNASNKEEQPKQRKSTTEGNTGTNPIHHIAASGAGSSPARQQHGTNESASVLAAGTANETGRRTSTTTAPTNNTTTMTTTIAASRNTTTKPCCFCWCCCYRCTCLSSRNQEEEMSKSKDITSRDSWSNDPDVTPSVEEIRCWGDSFDRLMKSSMGRVVFREFLKCEYSEENILFWLACEDLKKDNNPEVVEEKARLIYEDYISILSPKEVSLDSRVREIVNRNMVDPTPHTFDEAQLQIYTLMHRDSYPRFVNSTYYKKLAQLSSTSRKESSA
uniref:RGS domain-containing protein n=1 Tax=Daphnia galeata TaxID=27404 RepID=A0A8J2WM09_9CRUS|nr:unnamed protein product [Daphnia galeata]